MAIYAGTQKVLAGTHINHHAPRRRSARFGERLCTGAIHIYDFLSEGSDFAHPRHFGVLPR